jgi:hypothetical protein
MNSVNGASHELAFMKQGISGDHFIAIYLESPGSAAAYH